MRQNLLQAKVALSLSTKDVDDKRSFEYWKEVVCNHVINVDCEKVKKYDAFYGRLLVERYGDIVFSEMYSQSARFIRRQEHIQKIGSDFMLVTLRLDSKAHKIVDSKAMNICSNDISLYHGSRKTLLHVDGGVEALIFNLPLKYVEKYIPCPEDLHGRIVSGGSQLGSLASSYMMRLASQMGRIPDSIRLSVIDNFLQLLSICVLNRHDAKDLASESIQLPLTISIKDFILLNIADHRLSPELIAKQFRISLRYLYNIFRDENITPWQFITEQRLQRAKDQLCCVEQAKVTVSEIAYSLGFNNVSHFCRLFKKKFGLTPSELRRG